MIGEHTCTHIGYRETNINSSVNHNPKRTHTHTRILHAKTHFTIIQMCHNYFLFAAIVWMILAACHTASTLCVPFSLVQLNWSHTAYTYECLIFTIFSYIVQHLSSKSPERKKTHLKYTYTHIHTVPSRKWNQI